MTWKEFKDKVESLGLRDDAEIADIRIESYRKKIRVRATDWDPRKFNITN